MIIEGGGVFKVKTIHDRWLPLSAIQILCGFLECMTKRRSYMDNIFVETRDGVPAVHYWEHRLLREPRAGIV